tara:strand:+ start:399 stop:1196 length:798 start_codon:yes stop_codon:yes gene_type:complete
MTPSEHKEVVQLLGRHVAATCIQAAWRDHRFCLDLLQLDDDAMISFVYSQQMKAREVDSAIKIQARWRAKSVRLAFDAARRWAGIVEGCPFARLTPLSRHRLRVNLEIIFKGFPGLRYNYVRKKRPYPPREAACSWGVETYQEDRDDWLEDDFEPVQVYPPHHDDHVAVNRSVPRVHGQVAFDVTYASGPNKGYWQRVPITHFMDFDNLTFSHQVVTDAVNDWVQTASEFPKARRNCIYCNRPAEKGKVLCWGCIPKYQAIIEAE